MDRTHEVDDDGVRIWFAMWPEMVRELTAPGDDAEKRLKFFQIQGKFRLEDVADSSHRYLYGHRYWARVKAAVDAAASGDRWQRIESIVERSGVDEQFGYAMAAIALMTLEQCGPAFLQSGYEPADDRLSVRDWMKRRATPLRPGLMDRLRGQSSTERVIHEEGDADGWFALLPGQEITTAAELDKRDHHLRDARCYEGMGAIPVDCRAGSCGTCWVGVIGGNENLEPAEDFERRRMEYFGYWDSGFVDGLDERPLIRLSCQVRAHGSVSIVIPPWNGVFGRSRREREMGD